MESLKEKVTIITGGAGGFGRATALLFAKYGAKLVLADLNNTGAEAVAEECKKAGLPSDDILTVEANITKEDDRKKIIEDCISKFGRLDVLINNAGIGRIASLMNTPPDVYDAEMDLNVKAQLYMTQLAVPHLKATKGNIVNLASIASEEVFIEFGVYGISKAAVAMFTKTLALEMAEFGVRVNEVRPGVVHTNFYEVLLGGDREKLQMRMEAEKAKHPLGRLPKPEEVANAIAFLASDMASYTTGNAIYVDGGRHCVGAGFATR
ncbi:3-oxoacyl-[acyl-carrier-protein] reductase FabG-like isoform X1 [Pecten maximus]|uniref:3-oxoacyl-[acyl-carrier-protein] reductase FabG-like isoform X1 n=1 Tax=Pecten maximus TaxID=6579 RepID=UPI001457FA30|nr:3-oxoacyl-[acyl-carrier-protein] reductase FabG-like isoform X1 [Pecten maximus]